jgi:signal transduction histidine kinase
MERGIFLNILSYLPHLIIRDQRVVDVSYPFINMTGYSQDDFISKDVSEVLYQLFRGNFSEEILECTFERKELHIFTKTLQVRHVDLFIQRNKNDNESIFIFLEKSASREEQARIISNQEKLLDTIVENTSDALYILDAKGNYVKLNKAARSFYLSEIPVQNILDRLKFVKCYDRNWNEIPIEDTPFYRVLCGEKVEGVGINFKHPDGDIYLDVSCTPVFSEDSRLDMAIVCCKDVSEHIKYEKAIKKQCYQICKVLNDLDLPIIRLTYPEFRLIEINRKAYEEILSLDACNPANKALIKPGESVFNILPGFFSDGSYKNIFKIQGARKTIQNSNICLMKDGNKAYYNAICQPIFDLQGEITEVIVAAMDVTDEIMEKEDVKRLMRIKDEFFTFISHEFKTPLTVINAAIQALELICGKELSEKAMKFIRQIRQNSLRQLRLVNNLLEITRAESGYLKLHKRNIDIVFLTKEIIESVLQYSKGKNINLSFHSSLSKKVIAIDDKKYERILLNLLSNAIKFTPAGKNIFVRVYSKRRQVCIEVKDEGVGIPKQKQNLIFDRFGQVDSDLIRNAEGTGIGLSLVKLLVNAMKGKIVFDSVEGIGSTFTIILPDERCSESGSHAQVKNSVDDRLIHAVEIELSDIYKT